MTLTMTDPTHRRILRRWLRHADTIVGMNLQFDISYLRAFGYRRDLPLFSRTLIDLSYVNFLHSDVRPERSLKSLGPILGQYVYEKTAKNTRFRDWDELRHYNAEDTHNTLLAVATLAGWIQRDFPGTAKLSDESIRFFSDTIWSCVGMTENGVPWNRQALQHLERTLTTKIDKARHLSASRHNLLLAGPGSKKSKLDLMERAIEATGLDRSELELTPTTREISVNDTNRNRLDGALSEGHPLKEAFHVFNIWSKASKMNGSYVQPYLHHRANHPDDRTSVMIPGPGGSWLTHPTWFVVPSAYKDGAGDSGGTQQARIVCKKGAHQTDPPEIQACRCSRWSGGRLISRDASQIELRVAALLSGEPSMLSEYQKPHPDLHTDMTVRIFGEEVVNHPHFHRGGPHDPRQVGKQSNFLILFRGGPDKLRATVLELCGTLLAPDEARRLVEAAKAARPVLWAWQERLLSEVRRRGHLVLPITGHSRTFYGGDKFEDNEIVNMPVQTTAANAVLDVQHRLQRAVSGDPDIKIFLNVYDAIYADVRTPEAAARYHAAFDEAIHASAGSGYWAQLQDHYGHEVPLVFE